MKKSIIKDTSSSFGRRYHEAEVSGDKKLAYEIKTEWSRFRDTLSGDDRELCVEAFVDAESPLSEEARQLRDKTE